MLRDLQLVFDGAEKMAEAARKSASTKGGWSSK
jgi:hypothetical protein